MMHSVLICLVVALFGVLPVPALQTHENMLGRGAVRYELPEGYQEIEASTRGFTQYQTYRHAAEPNGPITHEFYFAGFHIGYTSSVGDGTAEYYRESVVKRRLMQDCQTSHIWREGEWGIWQYLLFDVDGGEVNLLIDQRSALQDVPLRGLSLSMAQENMLYEVYLFAPRDQFQQAILQVALPFIESFTSEPIPVERVSFPPAPTAPSPAHGPADSGIQ